VIIGIYEIKKYVKVQKKLYKEVDEEVKDLLSTEPIMEEYDEQEPSKSAEVIEDVELTDENIENEEF